MKHWLAILQLADQMLPICRPAWLVGELIYQLRELAVQFLSRFDDNEGRESGGAGCRKRDADSVGARLGGYRLARLRRIVQVFLPARSRWGVHLIDGIAALHLALIYPVIVV
jgi:hypothetical protein